MSLSTADRYKIRTGGSWAAAIKEFSRLQQEAREAESAYLNSFDDIHPSGQQAFEYDMRMKVEDAMAYWKHIWTEVETT